MTYTDDESRLFRVEEYPDSGPVADPCSLCLGTGECPECNGGGHVDLGWKSYEQLRERVVSAVDELRKPIGSGLHDGQIRCRKIADELDRQVAGF